MARATILALILILSAALGLSAPGARAADVTLAQASGVINKIIVNGTNRIDPETVQSYMTIRVGDEFDSGQLDRSLKSLFATGLFADVTFRRQGDQLIVNVVENPVINRIAFEGNDVIEDSKLRPEITLRPRVIYTRTKVQNDVRRLLTIYRRAGRYSASIEAKVIQLPQNRVDLIYEINEGEPSKIAGIRFIGNKNFDDSDLREVIQTKESRWYRFLSKDDVYDPDRLTLDRELLRNFYLEHGYADFRVISAVAELTPNRKNFFVTFTVDEGDRYQIGKVDIDARLKNLDPKQLRSGLDIQTGDWYDSKTIKESVDNLNDAVGKLGYAFVDVRPRIQRNRAKRTVDLTFEINEGPRVFVERIDVVGNVRTIDKVIRREFRMVEGDAFNSTKLRRSRERINNLGFFKSVKVERLPGSAPDKTVIRAEVEEKSTGSLSIGAGFSSDDGPLVNTGISEKNLFGAGYKLNLAAQLSGSGSQVDFSFTDPYFLDRDLTAGVDVFRRTRDNQDTSSYDLKMVGTRLRVGYPITEHLRQDWTYELSDRTVENVDSDASLLIKTQAGSTLTSSISHSLTYDMRDSAIFPTEGYLVGLSNDLAGFGGDSKYLRTSLKASYYKSVTDDVIFNLSGRTGYIFGLGKDVGLVDRFFLGGSSLRGFAPSGVGPRDYSTNDSLGGEFMYAGTAQLSFPIGLPKELDIRGRMFSDAGSLSKISPDSASARDTGSLRVSTGVGLTWGSPFGPVGIDLTKAIVKENFDETETLRFNFGTQF